MDIPKLRCELEESKKVKEEADKKLKETVHDDISNPDLNDTMNEFFTVDSEMRGMTQKMNLKQRQKLNGIIKKFVAAL